MPEIEKASTFDDLNKTVKDLSAQTNPTHLKGDGRESAPGRSWRCDLDARRRSRRNNAFWDFRRLELGQERHSIVLLPEIYKKATVTIDHLAGRCWTQEMLSQYLRRHDTALVGMHLELCIPYSLRKAKKIGQHVVPSIERAPKSSM
ncbi:MAG: uncharacterized protein A8A55_2713 [Amphiamblys sp. WSBS2006]|nr:MAG: uncharacterized protein A8A55_2713 [Amphiamblys sp. WSBS2006]